MVPTGTVTPSTPQIPIDLTWYSLSLRRIEDFGFAEGADSKTKLLLRNGPLQCDQAR